MTHWQIVALMKAKRVRGLDVAERAKVSQSTVVRVLAREDGVREDRLERVWQVLEEMLSS